MLLRCLRFFFLLIAPNVIRAETFFTFVAKTPDKKYYANNKELDLINAEKQCNILGGTLVTIRDKFDDHFVRVLTSGLPREWYWIGAKNEPFTSNFTWFDGTPMSPNFTRWDSGQPNAISSCTGINYNRNKKSWDDDHCKYKAGSMCEVSVGVVVDLPFGFVIEDGSRNVSTRMDLIKLVGKTPTKKYFLNYDKLDFYSAEKLCNKLNGSLATMRNRDDYDFINITFTFSDLTLKDYWLGAVNEPFTKNFTWFDGTPVDYRQSGVRRPISCAGIVFKREDKSLDDIPCQWKSGSMCEADYVEEVTTTTTEAPTTEADTELSTSLDSSTGPTVDPFTLPDFLTTPSSQPISETSTPTSLETLYNNAVKNFTLQLIKQTEAKLNATQSAMDRTEDHLLPAFVVPTGISATTSTTTTTTTTRKPTTATTTRRPEVVTRAVPGPTEARQGAHNNLDIIYLMSKMLSRMESMEEKLNKLSKQLENKCAIGAA